MMTTQQFERWKYEIENIKKLSKFVDRTISSMATSTNLRPNEVLSILENIQVKMVGELRDAVEEIEDIDIVESNRVDPEKLSWEIERVIEAISFATDLNTEEITTIFSNKPGASVADVSYRLHKQSAHDRASF